jgi:hypothetical protein
MTTTCARFCTFVNQHLEDYNAIRQHILTGVICPDAWLILARMVPAPERRLECINHALRLAPDDLDLQITLQEQLVTMHPNNEEHAGKLRQLRALRVVRSVRPRALLRREPPREIGRILVEAGILDQLMLSDALREQRARREQKRKILLGELLIERKVIAPRELARVLTIQFQERQECGQSPSMIGEYLVREGLLTLDSLEVALLEQIRLHQIGKHESLGHILITQGKLHWAELKQVLEMQQREAELAFV